MIHYEDLVFPQVPELSRDLPVWLPLGGCRNGHLKIVGDQQALLLPAIPYGYEPPLELDLEPAIASLVGFFGRMASTTSGCWDLAAIADCLSTRTAPQPCTSTSTPQLFRSGILNNTASICPFPPTA